MELSFSHFNTLEKSATLSFQPDSPMYKVLLQMNTSTVSQNVTEIADATGLDEGTVESLIDQFYQAGLVYVEQALHYTLSRYGKTIAAHVVSQSQAEYNYTVPTTATYNKVIALFKDSPAIAKEALPSLLPTAPVRKAFNDLLQRGYIVENQNSYALSTVGAAHTKYREEMRTLSDAQLEEAYQYFKKAHPEYKYVYKFMDTHADNKKVLFNDVRKYIKGAVIAENFSSQNVPTIQKWWGGENIPPHTSIEAAIGKEIQYMTSNIKHVGEAAPTMDDVKTARTYIAILSAKTTPEIVSTLLQKHPKGSVLPDSVIVDMAKQIVGKAFPSNLDIESVEDAIGQVINKNRDIRVGRFLPTDTVMEMAPVVATFLREGEAGIEAFNLFQSEANHAEDVVEAVFRNSTGLQGLDLHNIKLAANISGIDFSNCNFSNAQLENAAFSECNFSGARFVGANLDGATFSVCNLDQANFENAAGLGDPSTKFLSNTGTPLNFFAISGRKSTEEWKRAVAAPQKAHLEVMMDDSEKELAKVLAEQLRQFVYKTAALRGMLSKLAFVATADRKQDLLNLLNPKLPIADWITKDALVQMIKDGELARLGIDPKNNGKLIGRVSQYEKEKEQTRPKGRYEELAEGYTPAQQQTSTFAQQLAAFLEANKEQHLVSRDGLLKLIPDSAKDIRGLVSVYGTEHHIDTTTGLPQYGLTPHDLEEISLQLNKAVHSVSNDSSTKVTAKKHNLQYFAYTSRISPINQGGYSDRGEMHLDYPQTFGVILEPATFGVTDPDVRKMIDALTTHDMWRKNKLHPASGHWKNAVATSRVQPHVVEQKDIASTKKNTKKVWIMVELQSDPYQKNMYTLGDVIDPKWSVPTNAAWKETGEDKTGGMPLNSEPHRMLNVLADLESKAGNEDGVDPQLLAEWGQKDSTTINYTLDAVAEQWDVNTATQNDFKSVMKMFLKSGTVPAVILTPEKGQEETKKTYQRVSAGEAVANILLTRRIITPIFVKDADAPTYVGADGKQFNKYQADTTQLLPVIKAAMVTVLKNAIKELRDSRLVTVSASTGNIKLSDYGKTTQYIYTKLSKFRQHYRDWPEMVILETINRALDMGIDEIWIPSASEYMRSPATKRDLRAYYDTPAQKFTNQLVSPPFEIDDGGSHLWTGVTDDYNPKQYYVIKLSDWKTPMKTSSLRFTASMYTNFVMQYMNRIKTLFPFLDSVPQQFLVESGFAYMRSTGKVTNDMQTLLAIQQDLNDEFNTNMQGAPANLVEALILGKVNLDKNLVDQVKKTGEEPTKLALEIFRYLIDKKYVEWSIPTKHEALQVFHSLIERHPTEFIGRAQQAYDDIRDAGMNPNLEGDVGQPVTPSGQPLPPEEEGVSDIDKLIQQQQKEQEQPKEEDIQFSPPSAREQHNLVEAEINRLLDALHNATTDEEKNRIRKRLHEMSTLAALQFNLFKLSTEQLRSVSLLTFAAVDQEFNRPKDVLKETPRNDFFQYEPAHGEAAPVGGGVSPHGIGDASDTSNMDMKGGFYTDLNLPDPHKKDKQLVQFEPSNHVNLQPSFIASFDFTRFKQTVMSGLRATAEFAGMDDATITEKLYQDYLFAKENDLL